jgi:hypothetical protein
MCAFLTEILTQIIYSKRESVDVVLSLSHQLSYLL